MTITKQARKMAADNDLNEEINQAYIDLAGAEYATADECAEAYAGEFSSDKDFAENMAEELGEIDQNAKWPHSCIDWEWASRELMMDYSEEGGYYFRNL